MSSVLVELESADGDERDDGVVLDVAPEAVAWLREWCTAETSDSLALADAIEESVELDDSRSECARVYLTVLISSSSGVRKDTRFSAGNRGRVGAILRGIIDLDGLLARMETK